jgi:hypothetical protein
LEIGFYPQEHHRTPTFQEEYRELLREHGSISANAGLNCRMNRAFSARVWDDQIPVAMPSG